MLINLDRSDLTLQEAVDGASPGDRIVLRDSGFYAAAITVDNLRLEGAPASHGTMTIGEGVHRASFATHDFHYVASGPPFDYTDGITFDIFAHDEGVDVSLLGLNATFHGGSGDDIFRFETPPSFLLYNAGGLSGAAHGGAGDDILLVNNATLNLPMSNSIGSDGSSGTISGGDQRSAQTTIEQEIVHDGFEQLHLRGGSAGDTLRGTRNRDTLAGNGGDDQLTGGAGRDHLAGGGGADSFVFAAGDSGRGGLNRDFIADFESGVDRIDLTAIGGSYSLTPVGSDVLINIGELQIQVRFASGSGFAEGDVLI